MECRARLLDAWRAGRGDTKDFDLQRLRRAQWLVERHKRSPAWKKVSERSRPEYERTLNMVMEHKLANGAELGLLEQVI